MLIDATSLPDVPDPLDAHAERVALLAIPIICRCRCLPTRRIDVMRRGSAERRPSDRSDTAARDVERRGRLIAPAARLRPRTPAPFVRRIAIAGCSRPREPLAGDVLALLQPRTR
jgi:hypothetical protein